MPVMFAVDENDDLYIGPDGNLAIVTGIDAVLQNCSHAAKAQLGEMVLATDEGVPNFQLVWEGNPNIPQFEAVLRNIFLSLPDVVDVLQLDVASQNKTLFYRAVILTTFGQGEISGQL